MVGERTNGSGRTDEHGIRFTMDRGYDSISSLLGRFFRFFPLFMLPFFFSLGLEFASLPFGKIIVLLALSTRIYDACFSFAWMAAMKQLNDDTGDDNDGKRGGIRVIVGWVTLGVWAFGYLLYYCESSLQQANEFYVVLCHDLSLPST